MRNRFAINFVTNLLLIGSRKPAGNAITNKRSLSFIIFSTDKLKNRFATQSFSLISDGFDAKRRRFMHFGPDDVTYNNNTSISTALFPEMNQIKVALENTK